MDDEYVKDGLASHAGAVVMGVIVGALSCYLMIFPSAGRIKQTAEKSNAACTPVSSSAAQERIDELTEELSRVKKQYAQFVDTGNARGDQELIERAAALQQAADSAMASAADTTITVLYEQDPRIAGLEAVLPAAGAKIPLMRFVGMGPRWIIPAKVHPIIYNAAGGGFIGVQYTYVDANGNQQGPFRPDILPVQQ